MYSCAQTDLCPKLEFAHESSPEHIFCMNWMAFFLYNLKRLSEFSHKVVQICLVIRYWGVEMHTWHHTQSYWSPPRPCFRWLIHIMWLKIVRKIIYCDFCPVRTSRNMNYIIMILSDLCRPLNLLSNVENMYNVKYRKAEFCRIKWAVGPALFIASSTHRDAENWKILRFMTLSDFQTYC